MATNRFGDPIVEEETTPQVNRFGDLIEPEAGPEAVGPGGTKYTPEQEREYGTISAPPPAGQRFLEEYVRPTAQAAGAAGGAVLAAGITAPTGPGALAGAVGGGGLGFAIGDEVVDLIEDWMGYREPKPLALELQESGEEILEGVTYELAGHLLTPASAKEAGRLAAKVPGVGWAGRQAIRPAAWVAGKFTKKGADRAAGNIIAAMTDKGPLVAKNWEEARALETAMPGLRFDLGQLTGEPGIIKFVKEGTETAADIAARQAEARESNTQAIQRFIQQSKEAGAGTRELKAPLERQRSLLEEAEAIAQRNMETEVAARRGLEDPAAAGERLRKEVVWPGEAAAREEAAAKFAAVPEQEQIIDDVYDEFKKIMKPRHRGEQPDKFPKILRSFIKDIEGGPVKPFEEAAEEAPETVYRGYAEGREFRGEGRPIHFSSSKELAKTYPPKDLAQGRKRIVDAYEVNLKNPKIYRGQAEKPKISFATGKTEVDKLKSQGYDGAIWIDDTGKQKEIVAFDESQVTKKAPKAISTEATEGIVKELPIKYEIGKTYKTEGVTSPFTEEPLTHLRINSVKPGEKRYHTGDIIEGRITKKPTYDKKTGKIIPPGKHTVETVPRTTELPDYWIEGKKPDGTWEELSGAQSPEEARDMMKRLIGSRRPTKPISTEATDIAISGKYTPAQLYAKHDITKKRVDKLIADGKAEEAMELAQTGQKWREAAEIMEGTHKGPGMARYKEAMKKGKKKPKRVEGEPTATLEDLQGWRSELLEDLRTAKAKGYPPSLRARLNQAIDAIDKKLGMGAEAKGKGKVVYHSSDRVFDKDIPPAGAHYFDEPDMSFGDNLYPVTIPDDAKILDLEKAPKNIVSKFFNRAARADVDPEDYTRIWSESDKLSKTAEEMGYDAVSFDTDRFVLTDKLNKRVKPGVPTKAIDPERVVYHAKSRPLEKGKPDFDAYYGDKSFKEGVLDEPESGFGKNLYAVELPKDAKILELVEGSPETTKFMAKAAKLSGQPDNFIKAIERGEPEAVRRAYEDFNAFWNVGDDYSLKPILDDLGYDAAKFWNEFYIPKEVSKRARTLDPKTLKPIGERTPGQEMQEAARFYREKVIEPYHKGTMKGIMRGEESVEDALVTGKFFRPGNKGQTAAKDFNRAFGDDEVAKAALKDTIDQSFLNDVVKNDQITKTRYNNWLKRHTPALREYGLENEYDSFIKAREALDRAQQKSAAFDKSVASRVLNADVNDVVKQAFSGTGSKKDAAKDLLFRLKAGPNVKPAIRDATGEIHTGITHPQIYDDLEKAYLKENEYLRDQAEEEAGFVYNLLGMEDGFINPEGKFVTRKQLEKELKFYPETITMQEGKKALAGLQNAIIDEILTEAPLGEQEIGDLLTSTKMASQLRKYDAAIREVFKREPQKINAMNQVRRAVKRMELTTPLPRGEERTKGVVERIARNYGHSKVASARIAINVLDTLFSFLPGVKDVNNVVNKAILDPELAVHIMNMAKGGNMEKKAKPLINRLISTGLITMPKEEE